MDREFEGFVLATISCGIGDVIESIVSPSMAPILRLYFSPCSQSPTAGLKAERLQLYQLNASLFPIAAHIFLLCTIELFALLSENLQRFLWHICFERVAGKDVLFIDG